jgi:hypothetical protein
MCHKVQAEERRNPEIEPLQALGCGCVSRFRQNATRILPAWHCRSGERDRIATVNRAAGEHAGDDAGDRPARRSHREGVRTAPVVEHGGSSASVSTSSAKSRRESWEHRGSTARSLSRDLSCSNQLNTRCQKLPQAAESRVDEHGVCRARLDGSPSSSQGGVLNGSGGHAFLGSAVCFDEAG